eukprot:12621589-Heterocapsa_arctica.AAC.1
MVREPGAAVHCDAPCPGSVVWHGDSIQLSAVVGATAGVRAEADKGAPVLNAEAVEAGKELLFLGIAGFRPVEVEVATEE